MKVNKHEQCPCGSGKKYKRCCSPAAPVYPDFATLSAVSAAPVPEPVTASDTTAEGAGNEAGNG